MVVNIIAIIVILGVIIFFIKDQIKHIKGEGGGCCGETLKVPKKKLKEKILGRKKVYITGMHCKNCENHVTLAINSIDGASTIKVSAPKNFAVLEFDHPLDNAEIIQVIEKEGFSVSKIEEL